MNDKNKSPTINNKSKHKLLTIHYLTFTIFVRDSHGFNPNHKIMSYGFLKRELEARKILVHITNARMKELIINPDRHYLTVTMLSLILVDFRLNT